ncbi:MAG: methylated-DNA--[protein]-cysteine S-methyltransferase [Nitrospira sp.]|nr:methylated-DNA--[protein]-cysteine S-methyltransferase [Nitrospira sp.]
MPSAISRHNARPAKTRVRRDVVSYCIVRSPVGRILLAGNAHTLTHLSFQDGRHPVEPDPRWIYAEKPFQRPIRQLHEYFSGKRKTFTIKLAPQGTPFQQRVWQALRAIPYGRTLSYGQIAKAIGQPTASRAVGAANGQNPISIIVPCHRVIGSNGNLVGYGGGLSIKETLLTHESNHQP